MFSDIVEFLVALDYCVVVTLIKSLYMQVRNIFWGWGLCMGHQKLSCYVCWSRYGIHLSFKENKMMKNYMILLAIYARKHLIAKTNIEI